ncbi:LGFP repeat-containing protein [Nocardia sp. NPDC056064]|uniref:LGFP repeat-containing protein n=1 Tax=Nocardia sp. NPDC056064 TaxID=3345701 RepID=UPI0035DD37E7
MRSDREDVPGGFSKADADKAETMEAKIREQAVSFVTPGCQVYWPSPFEVCGAIKDKYNELGGPNSFLLWPTSNEIQQPDGIGAHSVFTNGPIFWSPWGGAHPVVNHFYAAWQRNGWEGGVLGYPTSDEIVNPDGIGRRQYFDGGTIYWKLNEAYFVGGAIRDKWGETGWEGGWLGYPTSDENVLPDGQGRMNKFEHGRIYWSPSTGAHPVAGRIEIEWGSEQYESGMFGYPVSDERVVARADSREQDFQEGTIAVPNPLDGGDGPDEDDVRVPTSGGDDYAPNADWRTGQGIIGDSSPWDRCATMGSPTTDGLDGCAGPGYIAPSGSTPNEGAPGLLQDPISLKPGCDRDYEKKKADALAHRPLSESWWQEERLYSCAVNPFVVEIEQTVDGKPAGIIASASGKVEQELITHHNRTTSDYRVRVTVEHISGTIAVTGSAPCTGISCPVIVHDEIVNEPLTPGAQIFGFYEFGPNGLAPNQIMTLIMEMKLRFTSPGAREKQPGSLEWRSISPEIRCDNETNVPGISVGLQSQGCVFPSRTPVVDFASEALLTPIADHVRQAQQSGLPGAPKFYWTGPLSRMTNEAERRRNGGRACPSGRYSATGRTCDEYPFKSTYQGAAQPSGVVLPPNGRTFTGCEIDDPPRVELSRTGSPGYSVCMIDAAANNRQGDVLATFYYENRVMDGDQFYVRADPTM